MVAPSIIPAIISVWEIGYVIWGVSVIPGKVHGRVQNVLRVQPIWDQLVVRLRVESVGR